MPYFFNNGRGFLANATAIGTASYLFTTSGYLNDTIRIGFNDSGDRIIDDGGVVEAYACVDAFFDKMQAINSETGLLAFLISDIPNTATIESKSCLLDSYNELTAIQIA